MKINQRELSKNEENVIINLFNIFKSKFTETELFEKENYIGIGMPEKYYFCYFKFKDDKLCVKFKYDGVFIDAFEDLTEKINKTIEIFNNFDLTLNKIKREREFQLSKNETLSNELLNSQNIQNQLNNFSNEDIVFLKILSQNIDPKTGEVLTISEDSLLKLKEILENISISNSTVSPTFSINDFPAYICESYKNGKSLAYLSKLHNVSFKILKNIIKENGLTTSTYLIRNFYTDTAIANVNSKENIGKKYNENEDINLIEEYKSGLPVYKIAEIHKRTYKAVCSRLVKLGFAKSRKELPEIYIPDENDKNNSSIQNNLTSTETIIF